MPSTRPRENRAVGGGTFAERPVGYVMLAAVRRVGVLGVIVVVGAAFAPVADEERASLLDARAVIAAGRIRAGDALAAALSVAQRMPQLWAFGEHLPHLAYVVEDAPHLQFRIPHHTHSINHIYMT